MIFLDANVFLRYLVDPADSDDRAWHGVASALFDALERGDEEATTSEAVLAEVAFILSSRRQYGLPPPVVSSYLAPIIQLRSLTLPRGRKQRYLRALDLWAEHPRLGFVDALTAAEVERSDLRLATFDADFDGLPGILRWEAPAAPG